jgi:undecaprenyl diphosphate synthase
MIQTRANETNQMTKARIAGSRTEGLGSSPFHLGIIPDGNRRHARVMQLTTDEGYQLAAEKALEVLQWCRAKRIAHVSAFGVSQENIALRPAAEIFSLHAALLHFCNMIPRLPATCLHVFGAPALLPAYIPARDRFIAMAKYPADHDVELVVHVGVNYSARAELDSLLKAVTDRGFDVVCRAPSQFTLSAGVPPVDLVIRTGGQRRLSGFLPFQTSYSELWFTETLWPAFTHNEFAAALEWYEHQDRRFGE